MSGNDISWIILRFAYAWVFLYPVSGLVKNWSGTVATTGLLFKKFPELFAGVSVLVMAVGGLSILFGIYGRVGAAVLLVFNLGGAVIHYRIADQAQNTSLSAAASAEDHKTVELLAMTAAVGHTTSAWKNFVLAAVAFFFLLQGTGPWSLIAG